MRINVLRNTALALLLTLTVTGCANLPKKFIRKTKPKEVKPVVTSQREYTKEFSNKYYYSTHFTQWKTWQDEILNQINGNAKRQERAAEEAIAHLEEMQKLLLEPKQSELGKQIATVKQAAKTLVTDRSRAAQGRARTQIERTRRVISADFDYKEVAAFVAPEQGL